MLRIVQELSRQSIISSIIFDLDCFNQLKIKLNSIKIHNFEKNCVIFQLEKYFDTLLWNDSNNKDNEHNQ